jgi:phosphohistidine phosphatase
MKFLTLIRHAKSSRDNPQLPDNLRPLNPRGLRDAPAMGKYLDTTFRFAPDIIVSSPATRAIHTARLIAEGIGYGEWQIKQDERIYEAPVSSLLEVIREQPDKNAHVCLVGHNPGMENLTNWLCGTTAVENAVTCAVIMLELDIESWEKTDAGKARLREYIYPALIGLGKEVD